MTKRTARIILGFLLGFIGAYMGVQWYWTDKCFDRGGNDTMLWRCYHVEYKKVY